VGIYAKTKVEAESIVVSSPGTLIVRIPLLYGASLYGGRSVGEQLLAAVRRGESPILFYDEFRTPLHAIQAARLLWELVSARETGILHIAGRDRVSRYDLGCAIAARLGIPTERLRRASIAEYTGRPPRCPDVSLSADRVAQLLGKELPGLAEGLRLPLAHEAPPHQ